jgi:galactose mutarotase-like enzyme
MADPQNSWIPLRSAELYAEVNPCGAHLSVLRDAGGRDLLWNGDPAVWTGRAPILFPIVGELAGGQYHLDGKSYPLSRHGFARGKPFNVVAATTSSATFRLGADEATLAVYPFQFELDVRFALHGATLTLITSVRNLGETDMPASCGFHPGFRWPLPYGRERSAHFIEFSTQEPAPIKRLNSAGLVTSEPHPTPVSNRRLVLEDALFANDALIFDQVRSRAVTYGAVDGPRIRVSFPDAPYLGIWTKPGAPFICIEPWHGIADPAGFTGDITAKPGIFTVAPGGVQSMEVTITQEAPLTAGPT